MNFNEVLKSNGDDLDKIKSYFRDTKQDRAPLEYLGEYENLRNRRTSSVGFRIPYQVGSGDNTKTIYPAQVVLGFPRKIVNTATAFVCGGNMSVNATPKKNATLNDDLVTEFKDVWIKSLKMQNVIKEFVRTIFIETKSAIIFFPQDGGETVKKLRCKVLKSDPNLQVQDEFYPHFDQFGDMDAFLWSYEGIDNSTMEPARITYIFTAEKIYEFIRAGQDKKMDEKQNFFGKIPVVYGERKYPLWEPYVSILDRIEMRLSRLSDCNDYFAEPMLKIFGEPTSIPGKDRIGKMVKFESITTMDGKESKGDAEYLTWDQTPESIKLEIETFWNAIYTMSNTPDMSFNSMKTLGTISSSLALKVMFSDAIVEADINRELFDPLIQRMANVVKAGLANIVNLKLKSAYDQTEFEINFGLPLPDDLSEQVKILMLANGDKPIASQETTVNRSPLTSNTKEEWKRIQEESETQALRDQDAQQGTFFSSDKANEKE